jgi:hypothetical protein
MIKLKFHCDGTSCMDFKLDVEIMPCGDFNIFGPDSGCTCDAIFPLHVVFSLPFGLGLEPCCGNPPFVAGSVTVTVSE